MATYAIQAHAIEHGARGECIICDAYAEFKERAHG
jgi:hypothetical protein